MPGFYEKSLTHVGLNAHYSGVVKIDTVVVSVTVLCNSSPLPVKFSRIILVLHNPLMEVLCLADVSGRAFGTRSSVYNPLCFFFRRAVFGSWHQTPKRWNRLVGHLNTFFCQCRRFAGPLSMGDADTSVHARLLVILKLQVPMTAIWTAGHTTTVAACVAVLF